MSLVAFAQGSYHMVRGEDPRRTSSFVTLKSSLSVCQLGVRELLGILGLWDGVSLCVCEVFELVYVCERFCLCLFCASM